MCHQSRFFNVVSGFVDVKLPTPVVEATAITTMTSEAEEAPVAIEHASSFEGEHNAADFIEALFDFDQSHDSADDLDSEIGHEGEGQSEAPVAAVDVTVADDDVTGFGRGNFDDSFYSSNDDTEDDNKFHAVEMIY